MAAPPPPRAHAPSLGPLALGVGGWVPEAAPAGPELRVRARAVRGGRRVLPGPQLVAVGWARAA